MDKGDVSLESKLSIAILNKQNSFEQSLTKTVLLDALKQSRSNKATLIPRFHTHLLSLINEASNLSLTQESSASKEKFPR